MQLHSEIVKSYANVQKLWMQTTTEAERTTATQNSSTLVQQTSAINTRQSALKAHIHSTNYRSHGTTRGLLQFCSGSSSRLLPCQHRPRGVSTASSHLPSQQRSHEPNIIHFLRVHMWKHYNNVLRAMPNSDGNQPFRKWRLHYRVWRTWPLSCELELAITPRLCWSKILLPTWPWWRQLMHLD